MRRVIRKDLSKTTQEKLNLKQKKVNQQHENAGFDVTKVWKTARQTKPLKDVLGVLQQMAGDRHRCMYCLDSHGTDIEHFWPKTPYPEKMFAWLNLLLCCTECGRLKGDTFPLENNAPLLVDPTAEAPWMFLDFDPSTGNVVARFDQNTNAFFIKGVKTVETLQLDRREALACGYKRTLKRIEKVVNQALNQSNPLAETLVSELREADDHGLLYWCFFGSGKNDPPFIDFSQRHPSVWSACINVLKGDHA